MRFIKWLLFGVDRRNPENPTGLLMTFKLQIVEWKDATLFEPQNWVNVNVQNGALRLLNADYIALT